MTEEAPPPTGTPQQGIFVPPWAIAVVVVLLLGVAGLVIGLRSSGGSSRITLHGALELDNGTSGFDDTNYASSGDGCAGTDGYSDLAPGVSITVYDNSGKVVSVGALGSGTDVGSACIFTWLIHGVPKSPFYKVEISHRGQLTYSYQQATAGGLDSSIGQ